jgi:hypothetical protein
MRTLVCTTPTLLGACKVNFNGAIVDSSRLSLSNDKATAIAGLGFETRKQIGPRTTSLVLLSEYEWYGSVPQMRYDNLSNGGTKIDEDSAFATRRTFRLNIGLGPAALYAPPLK